MTASEILTQLRAARVEVRLQGDMLLCRPAEAISADLRQALIDNKPELQALLTNAVADAIKCSACGQFDYMPIGQVWRRCWSCGHRWGPRGIAPRDETYGLERPRGPDRKESQSRKPHGAVDRCRTHELYTHRGDRVAWWYRRCDAELLCGLCHPAPSPPAGHRN